jgi:hypothetical protein
MNLVDCPKCGTTIDLHYIPGDHETPDGEWCDIDAVELGGLIEANELCVRCGDVEGDGKLDYIGDGYSRHSGVCPGAVCHHCGRGGDELEWKRADVRGGGMYWKHPDCSEPNFSAT